MQEPPSRGGRKIYRIRQWTRRLGATLRAAPPMEATLAVVLLALVIVGGLTEADARIKGAVGELIGDFNRTVVALLQ